MNRASCLGNAVSTFLKSGNAHGSKKFRGEGQKADLGVVVFSHSMSWGYSPLCLLWLLQPPPVLLCCAYSPAACFQICPPSSPYPKKFHFSDDWYSWGKEKWMVAQEGSGWGGGKDKRDDGHSPRSLLMRSKQILKLFKSPERIFLYFPSSRQSALVGALVFSPFQLDHSYPFLLSLLFVSSVYPPFSLSLQQVRGYSFRRQARSVSLLLEVTARRREREEEVGGVKREKKEGKKAIEGKQSGTTAMWKKRKKGARGVALPAHVSLPFSLTFPFNITFLFSLCSLPPCLSLCFIIFDLAYKIAFPFSPFVRLTPSNSPPISDAAFPFFSFFFPTGFPLCCLKQAQLFFLCLLERSCFY